MPKKYRYSVFAGLLFILSLMLGHGTFHTGSMAYAKEGVTPTFGPTGPVFVEGQSWSTSGYFNIIWGDGTEGATQTIYTLTDDSGQKTPLWLDESLSRSVGGILWFNRKQVNVAGVWATAISVQGAATGLKVTSISLAPAPETETWSDAVSPVAIGSKPWVTILCKFNDIAAEPHDRTYFTGMYAGTKPGLDHYWRELSYNTADVVGSNAYGWFVLPHPEAYYNPTGTSGGADLILLADDCTAAANASVNFGLYQTGGINMMFNSDYNKGWAHGGSLNLTLDGVTQVWRITWEPPWGYADISIIQHEMGHGFGLPHSSGATGATYDNAWDVMSQDRYNCAAATDPTYGCIGQHTISYHKDLLGWIPAGQKFTAPLGSTTTITLEQLALPATTNYKMAQIPIGGSGNHFYTVEARRLTGYDVKLAGAAVIIHEVDTTRSRPAYVIDPDLNGVTSDAGAMWLAGETFVDAANGISVRVDSATSTGFQVTIVNGTGSFGTIQFSSATYSVNENGGSAVITVTRTGGHLGSVEVSYATSDGTATAGSDYTATSGTLSWADGDTTGKTFTVPIINDSIYYEGNETVMLSLSAPTGGATLGPQSTAVLNLGDWVLVWLEAEWGNRVAPMAVEVDSTASSGYYVWIPAEAGDITDPSQAGGSVSFTLNLPVAGDYVIWGRVRADSTTSDNSFFVSMDSGSNLLWATPTGGSGWTWDLVKNQGSTGPQVYALGAGTHTLVIKQREDGTKLDRILITNDRTYVPQGLGEAISVDRYWIGGTGLWENPLNWSPFGLPTSYSSGERDSVYVANTSNNNATTYFSGAGYPNNSARLSRAQVYGSGQGKMTLSVTQGDLSPSYLSIGNNGIINQTGGSISTSRSSLTAGGVVETGGTYNLQAGSLFSFNTDFSVNGVFNQTGGEVSNSNFIWIGPNGVYNLSGTGTIGVYEGLIVGGVFNQNGGTVGLGVTNYYIIQGIYNLSNGTLHLDGMYFYYPYIEKNGTFNFSGGSLSLVGLTNTGTVRLSGQGTRSLDGTVENDGTFKAVNTTAVYNEKFNNYGAYLSESATQFFMDLVNGESGYIKSQAGDTYYVKGGFLNYSVMNEAWDTTQAYLVFRAGNDNHHQFFITGKDFGQSASGYQNNFSWGTLDVTGNVLYLYDGNATPGGALYVGRLIGLDITGNLVTNIIGQDGLKIYYDPKVTENNYLHGLTYILSGGGRLIPVVDTTPPTPNPLTWETPPMAISPNSITMVATIASDTDNPPISYYFNFVGSSSGGIGGADSGWTGSKTYTDTGLQPNHQYRYRVKARDSAPALNETAYSTTVDSYTHAKTPGSASFSNITLTTVQANWTANDNPAWTEYFCENTTKRTSSGWTTALYWESAGLTQGTTYRFRVKARNNERIETGWTDLGNPIVIPLLNIYLPLLLK